MSDTIRGVLPAQQRELPDPSLREVVFDVDELGVSYTGKPALKDVNLEIYRNFVTAFIGPSGCGKSTFIRCFNHMNALIPGAKIHGTIHYHGADL
jgi:phosphate transport system ATP-binding protein